MGLHVQLGGLFLRFSEGRRQTRETRHARDEKRKKKNAFRFRAPHLVHVSPRVFILSTVKRKFDACSVRYILIGSMVRVVSAKT